MTTHIGCGIVRCTCAHYDKDGDRSRSLYSLAMDTVPGDGKGAYVLDMSSSVGHSEFIRAADEPRRVRDDVPWRLWLVAVIGFWERAAFWGLTAPWRQFNGLRSLLGRVD